MPVLTDARTAKADPRQAKKDLARVERQLEKLAQREQRLHTALAQNATDYARVAELDGELRELTAERAVLEEEWLVLAEQMFTSSRACRSHFPVDHPMRGLPPVSLPGRTFRAVLRGLWFLPLGRPLSAGQRSSPDCGPTPPSPTPPSPSAPSSSSPRSWGATSTVLYLWAGFGFWFVGVAMMSWAGGKRTSSTHYQDVRGLVRSGNFRGRCTKAAWLNLRHTGRHGAPTDKPPAGRLPIPSAVAGPTSFRHRRCREDMGREPLRPRGHDSAGPATNPASRCCPMVGAIVVVGAVVGHTSTISSTTSAASPLGFGPVQPGLKSLGRTSISRPPVWLHSGTTLMLSGLCGKRGTSEALRKMVPARQGAVKR